MAISGTRDYPAVIAGRRPTTVLPSPPAGSCRCAALLTVPAGEVFPSEQLLDHIPALVEEIASYLVAPGDREIAANTAVMAKARELGQLRHAQRASVHQLLHEYEILGDFLETFLVEETERLQSASHAAGVLHGAAPADARRPRADAHDGGHVHQRVHDDDPGAERADCRLQPRGEPRAALTNRNADVRRGTA